MKSSIFLFRKNLTIFKKIVYPPVSSITITISIHNNVKVTTVTKIIRDLANVLPSGAARLILACL